MADEKKKPLPKLTSPKGIASFPWLTVPDTKFKAEGEYKVTLLVPEAEAQGLMETLDKLAEEVYQEAVANAKPADQKKKPLQKYVPFSERYDEEGNETGEIEFKFKMNASFTDKKTGRTINCKPKLFDAKGKLIEGDISVYGGSVIRVNFQAAPFKNDATKDVGVSLRMNAVQIIELVSGGGSNRGSDYGFDEEEGFEAEEAETFQAAGDGAGEEDF